VKSEGASGEGKDVAAGAVVGRSLLNTEMRGSEGGEEFSRGLPVNGGAVLQKVDVRRMGGGGGGGGGGGVVGKAPGTIGK